MSRDFGQIAPEFWTSETALALRKCGPEYFAVAAHLLTSPNARAVGLFQEPLEFVSLYTAVPLAPGTGKGYATVRDVLAKLEELEFAYYDTTTEWFWIPNMAIWQIGELKEKDNRGAWVHKEVAKVTRSPFYPEFFERYAETYALPERLAPRASKPKGSPSQALPKPLERSAEPLARVSEPTRDPSHARSEKETERESETETEGETLSRVRETPPGSDPVRSSPEQPEGVQVAWARSSPLGEYLRAGFLRRFEERHRDRKPRVRPPVEATALDAPLWSQVATNFDDKAGVDIFLDRAFVHPWFAKIGYPPKRLEEFRVEILTSDPSNKTTPQRGQANVAEASTFADLKRNGGANVI